MSEMYKMESDKVESEHQEPAPPRYFLCESATWYARAAVGVSFLSLILHIMAVASPYWLLAQTGSELFCAFFNYIKYYFVLC